jgi:hypothetical protein
MNADGTESRQQPPAMEITENTKEDFRFLCEFRVLSGGITSAPLYCRARVRGNQRTILMPASFRMGRIVFS